jgi:phenylacetate-CoA ligase
LGFKDPIKLNQRLRIEPEINWVRRGESRALKLFQAMAERVPAYKDFLKQHKFSVRSVRTFDDFKSIPLIDKESYLRKYPKEMLCWDGKFANGNWVVSTTSGSTGEPYYFPRQNSQDWQYAILAEMYLRNNFNIQKKKTLYIIAFPMGAWIGGLFTYEAIKLVAERGGYDLSIITPGINKLEVISAVKQLGNQYEQILIGSYAPFLKDILDDGKRSGIDWNQLNLGFIFSAEAFNEKFRDYIAKESGINNIYTATLNHYGTVDLGTMSHETPLSILLRRLAFKDEKVRKGLFPELTKQPTFTQYIPELFYFEQIENNLACSSYSGLPLVRYNLKDYGGIVPFEDVRALLKTNGYDLSDLSKKAKISQTVWNAPFVYVYERNDFSVSYYAFLIYPDSIRRGLQTPALYKSITGKFTMLVSFNDTGRQQLNVHVEMKHGVKEDISLESNITETIHNQLLKDSSEYRELYRMINTDAKPLVHLWKYEDPAHFTPGTKQKWVK